MPAIIGGAAALLLFVAGYQTASSQSAGPLPSLQLCRLNVSPCQSEINLPEGGSAVLAMSIAAPATPDAEAEGGRPLVGWFVRLLLESGNPSDAPVFYLPFSPFVERGPPDLALNNMKPLSQNAGDRPAENYQYYRVRNRHDAETGSLEYSVTLLELPSHTGEEPSIPLHPGQEVRVGNLPLHSLNSGTTTLVAEISDGNSAQIITPDPGGGLASLSLAAAHPLARVEVGPNAEKARLQGRIWSDLPAREDTFHPFTSTFRVEFWRRGAMPSWQGGSDSPVASYSALRANSAGEYLIKDLHNQVLPPGSYDLRARGLASLSVLEEDVHVDTSGERQAIFPIAVEVDFGPMPSGDANGDNLVNGDDLAALQEDFGKLTRNLVSDLHTDFNGDAVVDAQDFSLLAANFGQRGQ